MSCLGEAGLCSLDHRLFLAVMLRILAPGSAQLHWSAILATIELSAEGRLAGFEAGWSWS